MISCGATPAASTHTVGFASAVRTPSRTSSRTFLPAAQEARDEHKDGEHKEDKEDNEDNEDEERTTRTTRTTRKDNGDRWDHGEFLFRCLFPALGIKPGDF